MYLNGVWYDIRLQSFTPAVLPGGYIAGYCAREQYKTPPLRRQISDGRESKCHPRDKSHAPVLLPALSRSHGSQLRARGLLRPTGRRRLRQLALVALVVLLVRGVLLALEAPPQVEAFA